VNIALIFAGGTGVRMKNASLPKQFLQLYSKEIIIHTIENFENHPEIDSIVIVCIESWIPFLKSLIEKFNIKKVKWIVPGGENGQESIYNGLNALKNDIPDDSVILIHDGVRPLITQELLSECIASTLSKGNAISVTQEIETVISIDTNLNKILEITDRSKFYNAKAPQCFFYKDILKAHNLALSEGITNMTDSATLMKYYGFDLYTVKSGYENIKITTASDFYVFRALYEARENSQVFGL